MGEKIMIAVLCIVAGLTYGKMDSKEPDTTQPVKVTYYVVANDDRDMSMTSKDFLNKEIYGTGNIQIVPDEFSEVIYLNDDSNLEEARESSIEMEDTAIIENDEEVELVVLEPEETVAPERVHPEGYEPAVKIWDFLKENGFNDYVSAGIMGNIMAECGGQSLVLQPEIYGGSFYGICQWNKWDFPEVQGQDLDFQLNYLIDTIKSQFGDHYEGFISMESTRDAARSFAQFYERCVSSSYALRQNNAERAYDYFVNYE